MRIFTCRAVLSVENSNIVNFIYAQFFCGLPQKTDIEQSISHSWTSVRSARKMSKKLYVGNLPFSVNSEQLTKLFSEYGESTESAIISFKDTGKSKGFGFITLSDDSMAEKAVQEMNGKEIEGRKIVVSEAQPFNPDKPRERRPFRSGGFGGGRRFNRREDY